MRGLRYLMFVPMMLLLASITVGFNNYQEAKEEMHQDLTFALQQFVIDESRQLLLLDTIPALHQDRVLTMNDVESRFKDQLTILPLKDSSHISICLMRPEGHDAFKEEAIVSSDTLLWHSAQQESGDAVIALKAYANPSLCAVLGHSDQRLPITGLVLCLLMFSGMTWRSRMSKSEVGIAVISSSPSEKEIHLTPMQEQLMDMFASSPSHILSKETICAALWPKKERPENTLYTFISRLKVTLKKQSGMDIVNIRGKEYKLIHTPETSDYQDDMNSVRQL